jgi:hypothetical protein
MSRRKDFSGGGAVAFIASHVTMTSQTDEPSVTAICPFSK